MPGVQGIGNTAPDLPPVPGKHPTISRDHEYERLGTCSILAALDLQDGHVTAHVEGRHRSAEFIGLLSDLDATSPPECTIRILLDNYSAHISKGAGPGLFADGLAVEEEDVGLDALGVEDAGGQAEQSRSTSALGVRLTIATYPIVRQSPVGWICDAKETALPRKRSAVRWAVFLLSNERLCGTGRNAARCGMHKGHTPR
jgi:hypothetical protein